MAIGKMEIVFVNDGFSSHVVSSGIGLLWRLHVLGRAKDMVFGKMSPIAIFPTATDVAIFPNLFDLFSCVGFTFSRGTMCPIWKDDTWSTSATACATSAGNSTSFRTTASSRVMLVALEFSTLVEGRSSGANGVPLLGEDE